MKTWQDAYRALPDFFPFAMRDLLDLGCGTGLELESLFPVFPDLRVTAVDLCVPHARTAGGPLYLGLHPAGGLLCHGLSPRGL